RLRLVRRMFGVPGFHPIEAFRGESVQLLPRDPVRSRMRDAGGTARLVNEPDRLFGGQPPAVHPQGPVRVQEAIEGIVQALSVPAIDERAREVRAPQVL